MKGLLETYGVQPTNEQGIITGLDIAIMNLPDKPDIYIDPDNIPEKYLDTINYLVEKGYKAHGSTYQMDDETVISFMAPNRRNFQSSKVLIPDLKKAYIKLSW